MCFSHQPGQDQGHASCETSWTRTLLSQLSTCRTCLAKTKTMWCMCSGMSWPSSWSDMFNGMSWSRPDILVSAGHLGLGQTSRSRPDISVSARHLGLGQTSRSRPDILVSGFTPRVLRLQVLPCNTLFSGPKVARFCEGVKKTQQGARR